MKLPLIVVALVALGVRGLSEAVVVPLRHLRSRPPPRAYVVCRCTDTISIDGRLDEACWKQAEPSGDFVDIVGPDGPKPWFKTHVKMLWNDALLYIAAELEEPRAFAHLTLHDSVIFQDNDFEVFIDPDGDNWMYYEIEINALGHIWDLLLPKPYRNGAPAIHNWETIRPAVPTETTGPTGWQPLSAGVSVVGAVNSHQGSDSWTVELAVPWSILKQAANRAVPPKHGDQWRINFSRVQWNVTWDEHQQTYVKNPPGQSENNWVWSPQWQVAMHQPETWGYLQFQDKPVDSPDCPVATSAQPDITWPARALLMDIYDNQVMCWQAARRFCTTLQELNITDIDDTVAARLKIETTSVSFVASMRVPLPEGSAIVVMVDQLSRLTQYQVNEDGSPADPASAYNPFDGWSRWPVTSPTSQLSEW